MHCIHCGQADVISGKVKCAQIPLQKSDFLRHWFLSDIIDIVILRAVLQTVPDPIKDKKPVMIVTVTPVTAVTTVCVHMALRLIISHSDSGVYNLQ